MVDGVSFVADCFAESLMVGLARCAEYEQCADVSC